MYNGHDNPDSHFQGCVRIKDFARGQFYKSQLLKRDSQVPMNSHLTWKTMGMGYARHK